MEYFIVGWFAGLMTCWVVERILRQADEADRGTEPTADDREFPNHRPVTWE